MAEVAEQPMSYIPEVVLKNRRNNEEWAIRKKQQLEQTVKKKSGIIAIKKPEQFIREYRDKEIDLVRMKNRAKRKRKRGSSMPPESKPLFIIRVGGKNDVHKKTLDLMNKLRLRKKFTGVFVKANERSMDILQKIEPYVTYGNPSLKNVKDLIYKKGVVKFEHQTIPLTDNNIVEKALGEHNIICIEDMVNEIANVGPHFSEVSSFLCPFILNKPEKALHGKKKRFEDGGDTGYRGELIDELISKMN